MIFIIYSMPKNSRRWLRGFLNAIKFELLVLLDAGSGRERSEDDQEVLFHRLLFCSSRDATADRRQVFYGLQSQVSHGRLVEGCSTRGS